MGRDLGGGALAGLLVWTLPVVLMVVGCKPGPQADGAQRGPYRVVEVEVQERARGDGVDWAPASEALEGWLERAFRESDRGVSLDGDGLAMGARVNYVAQIENRRGGARLVVEVEVELERLQVGEGESDVVLVAKSEFRHPFALEQPSRPLLVPVSHSLARQAVDDAVGQLRDQALVRQALGEELVEKLNDSKTAESARVLAIERIVSVVPHGAVAALSAAADDPDVEVALAAARALFAIERQASARAVLKVAERMSRDRDYERYLSLLPMLGELDEPWVALYLETVAEGHRIRRVREQARALLEESALEAATGGP